jgi:hypothetical protein
MAVPWFNGSADPSAWGGGESPDPVTSGDTSWTWDVELDTGASPVYARSALTTFAIPEGDWAWLQAGIVAYQTQNPDGSTTTHNVGRSNQDGTVDWMWDVNVNSVTFGWLIGAGSFCQGGLNMEIWVGF